MNKDTIEDLIKYSNESTEKLVQLSSLMENEEFKNDETIKKILCDVLNDLDGISLTIKTLIRFS